MWACVRACMCMWWLVTVWQDPMEAQFLYWMDFTLYNYFSNKMNK